MNHTFIDIHVIQTVPPSNMNRDDTGSPKTAYYGGVRRSRVSSQAWKRATRTAFGTILDRQDLGVRTKMVVDMVSEEIRSIEPSLEHGMSLELAEDVVNRAGIPTEKPRAKKDEEAGQESARSSYLVFLSRAQAENLAELAVSAWKSDESPDKKAARAAANRDHSVDVALFGRMVADASDINVDASVQVAHAISVHAVDNEYDYFTAVDDRAPSDNPGAGMIGTVEFNSATLYRYATVDLSALEGNLGNGDAARRAVEAFIQAFVTSMPTGKQNTFANRTLPDGVVVMVREGQPVNLVGAFERAVTTRDDGYVAEACRRLSTYATSVDDGFGHSAPKAWVLRAGEAADPLVALGKPVVLDELVSQLGDVVAERVGDRA